MKKGWGTIVTHRWRGAIAVAWGDRAKGGVNRPEEQREISKPSRWLAVTYGLISTQSSQPVGDRARGKRSEPQNWVAAKLNRWRSPRKPSGRSPSDPPV